MEAEYSDNANGAECEANELVHIQSCDGIKFDMTPAVAAMSTTIKNMLENTDSDSSEVIELPNVKADVLKLIIEYCTHHVNDKEFPTMEYDNYKYVEVGEYDKNLCKVEKNTLFGMILAANYLDIKPMLDMTCKVAADNIRGKNTAEICEYFGVEDDLTPEEKAQILKDNEWCAEVTNQISQVD